jgi:stage II sporulation protein AA (anti-sigma F factor antagonist)
MKLNNPDGMINSMRLTDGTVMIDVRGELDFPRAGALRDTILEKLTSLRPPRVVIDLSLVTFMDSAALGALVTAQQAAADRGIAVTVANPSPFVARLLDVAGLAETLRHTPA